MGTWTKPHQKYNIEYIERHSIRLPSKTPTDYIQMYEYSLQSHKLLDLFITTIGKSTENISTSSAQLVCKNVLKSAIISVSVDSQPKM